MCLQLGLLAYKCNLSQSN